MKTLTRHLLLLLLLVALTHAAAAQTVYVTKTGEKYHKANCQYLRYSKIATTVANAKASGYGACSVCRPSTTAKKDSTAIAPATVPNIGINTQPIRHTQATQCTGTTKSGARCKRTTTNASGRCYQH